MGMSMVCFFIVLGIFYTIGLDTKIIGGGLMSGILIILIIWNTGLIQPYQKARFTGFLNPSADDAKTGYHLTQSLIGIGSGGILGTRPSLNIDGTSGYAAQNVPEIETDFIFSAIANQWGFMGAMLLLVLYGILIYKMISIARTSKDIFGSVICVGIVSYFLFAIVQNIGMTIGLMPITGITLPLISYGGSSLLTTVISVALVINVGMRRKKIHF
jgi:rod shape determining protein RodA